LIKVILKAAQFISPSVTAKFIYAQISKPRYRLPKASEKEVLASAKLFKIKFEGFDIQRYEWGETKNKTILLVHGWEGQTANFSHIIPIFVSLGYRVISFDAQSHGNSSTGKTHMFDYSNFLIEQFSSLSPSHIVTHSFGSVTTAMTLMEHKNHNIESWMMVTTPHTFKSRIELTSNQFGLNQIVIDKVVKLIEKDVKKDIDELNMVSYCEQLNQVGKVIILHSKTDRILPIEWSRSVSNAFTDCRLYELDNLGHYEILASKELKRAVRKYFPKQVQYSNN
jgi:predicted alpha/beta hydrolase family esterase